MSKLLRIDTNRNDGRFLPNFTTDIELGEDAMIALKDICFEPEFSVVNVNANNNSITTVPVEGDDPTGFDTQFVASGIYGFRDQFRLAQELTNALNRTLKADNTVDSGNEERNQFSSYLVRSESEDDPDSRLEIIYRLSPVIGIKSNDTFIGDYLVESNGIGFGGGIEFVTLNSREIIQQQIDNTDTDKHRLVAVKGVSLSKGSGIVYCQIFDSSVNAGFPERNGFTLGLTLEKVVDLPGVTGTTNPRTDGRATTDESIPATARNFEIDFREAGEVYRFRSGGLASSPALQNSTLNPHSISFANITQNDIVAIRVDTFNDVKVIEGVVFQHTEAPPNSGKENVLFRYELTKQDIGNEFGASSDPDDLEKIFFTPYLILKGKDTHCRVCNFRFTPDNTMDMRLISHIAKRDEAFFPKNEDNIIQDIDFVAENFQNVIPHTDRAEDLDSIQRQSRKSTITINNELGKPLGLGGRNNNPLDPVFTFTNQTIKRKEDRANTFRQDPRIFGIVGALFPFEHLPLGEQDVYYLVELNNVNLDSYSSIPNENLARQNDMTNQGERKNILATIPIGLTDLGRKLTYEPNELHFISIKNSQATNLRNLQVRILHPNYEPVQTFGRSHICLYVKG